MSNHPAVVSVSVSPPPEIIPINLEPGHDSALSHILARSALPKWTTPTFEAVVNPPSDHSEQVYDSYVVYCKYIGVTPRSIERWCNATAYGQQRPQWGEGDVHQAKPKIERGHRACDFAGQPACLTRKPERPVTFDQHVAKATYHPISHREQFECTQYRSNLPLDVKVPKHAPSKSLWCATCVAYVAQDHECRKPVEGESFYDTTARELRAVRQLALAEAAKRERNRLARLAIQLQLEALYTSIWFGSLTSLGLRSPVTAVADRVVVRSLSDIDWSMEWPALRVVGPLAKPYSGDYLRWVNPRTCKHLLKRIYRFDCSGATIEMCPDCTVFDKQRKQVLKDGEVDEPTPCSLPFYEMVLKEFGLSMFRGSIHPTLLWGNLNDLSERQSKEPDNHARRVSTASRVVMAQDSTERNEADKIWFVKDSCARDRRAKAIRNDDSRQVPPTFSVCARERCGKDFDNREGTKHCSPNCQKRDWEERRKNKSMEAA